MISFENLNLLAFITSLIFIGYSAYSDFRIREVPDKVWILYLPIAAIIFCIRIFMEPKLLPIFLVSIIATVIISFLTFYLGLFGGADFKAFVCLSIALPAPPFQFKLLLVSINPLFPVTIFYNAYLFSILMVFYALIRNLNWKIRNGRELFQGYREESISKKVLALLTGYKTGFKALKEKIYLYPMEEASKSEEGSHQRRLKLFIDAEADRNELIENLGKILRGDEKEEVWVTPGIPLLVFALAALIFSALIGDLMFWIISQLMFIIF